MRESEIERAICDYAKSKGWLVRKFVSPGHKGALDRLFINTNGTTIYLEAKAPGKKPTPLQVREIRLLQAQGCAAGFFDSVESGKALIDIHQYS